MADRCCSIDGSHACGLDASAIASDKRAVPARRISFHAAKSGCLRRSWTRRVAKGGQGRRHLRLLGDRRKRYTTTPRSRRAPSPPSLPEPPAKLARVPSKSASLWNVLTERRIAAAAACLLALLGNETVLAAKTATLLFQRPLPALLQGSRGSTPAQPPLGTNPL
jgi:hypothetical protein